MPNTNGSRRARRPTEPRRQASGRRSASERQRAKLIEGLGKQINDIYLQIDGQLTRMAHIQLQLDALRSKVRLL